MPGLCQLWLTCRDTAEADTITKALLEKRLVACAKQIPISSDFRWQGKIEHSSEVLLVVDSKEELFSEVELEVSKNHSYETFVLQAVPIIKVSTNALKWFEESIQGK